MEAQQKKQGLPSSYFGSKEEYNNFAKKWNETTAELNEIFEKGKREKEKYEQRSSSGIRFQ